MSISCSQRWGLIGSLLALVLLFIGLTVDFASRPATNPPTGSSKLALLLDEALSGIGHDAVADQLVTICESAEPRDDGTWDDTTAGELIKLLSKLLDQQAQKLYQEDIIPSQQICLTYRTTDNTGLKSITTHGKVIIGYADETLPEWQALTDGAGVVSLTQENIALVVPLILGQTEKEQPVEVKE